MDGTYNNPFAQGQSPSTPDTPSGGTYQVNVNRTKTRKWVEAKVQSYDGDDWGADEFDDDDEEPEPIPPVPRVTTGLRPVGQRLPSETLRSSPRLPAPVPSGSRSASGPPALHLQTGNTEEDHATPPIPHIPAHVQDTPRSTPSPVSGRNASPVPLPSQTAPPIASHPADARSSTSQSTVSSTPARSSPLTRPTEPAQRAEQEGKLADSQPTSNAGEVRQSQETLQRKESTQHYPELDLPDVGQVSFLDSSFLSGSKKDETESSDKAAADEPTIGLKSQAPVLLPMPDSQPIQPLRTPSPQVKDTVLPTESHHAASHQKTSAAGIIPTEPLQPRRPEHSPSDYEPQPIQREPTMSTITSSPVKENDVLSDEIMRSLGPSGVAPTIGPVGDTPSALALKSNTDPRDSSYTLSDYDSYWADGKEKPVAGEKNVESTTTPSQNTAQGSQETIPQNSASPDVSNDAPKEGDDDSGSRRRFSWEAIKAQPPANVPPKSNLPGTNDPPPPSQPDTQSTKDVLADVTSTRAETPKIVIPSESEPSSVPASQPLPSMLEPSSPVSTRTDESAMYGIENRRPSLVEEKMLAEPPTISESPPSDTQSVTSSTPTTKTGQMPQVMGLKEIMGLATSSQRLSQYEESQQAFAVVELGLKNWIQSLKTQHPEYANASSSFGGVSYQASTSGVNATSSSGLAPTQQPYYQQYLNASSPTTTTPSTSRSRLGGLPLSTQAATSAFGNSGNQIGTKSKEFMHSAGKMGKGLFSKGRSKLRGTGDKGEPIPPSVVHPHVRDKRRSSWGTSVSARSSTDREMTSMPGQDRPDSSYSGRMHPFRAASWSGESDGRYVSLRSLGPLSSEQWEKVHEESVPSNKGDGEENGREKYEEKEGKKADVTTWEIPMTMDRETTLWVPSPMAREPGVARDDSSEHSGAGLDKVDQARAHETAAPAASIDEDSDEEWVEIVSPHSTAASVRMVPAEPALVEARRPSLAVARGETRCPQAQSQTQFQPRILSQTKNEAHQEMSFPSIPLDPGPSIQQHAPKEAEPPQRNSSFVGLPLIRRGSTFGLTPKAARSAADHFSQNDEDGDHDVPFAPASVPSHPPGNSTAGNSVAPTMVEPISPNSLISRPEVTLPCQTTSARMSPDPEMVTSAPPEQPDPVTESEQDQTHPHSPGSPDHQHQQILSSNGAPPMIPPNMAGNPIQRLPPAGAGDWKLEESHLSEPLHSVSRNRAGTNNSQQHSSYGFEKDTGVTQQQPGSSFDKETGGSQRDQPQEPTYDEYDKDTGVTRPPLTLPTGPTPASLTSPVRHRHKPSSDVPPSTTNRYPELFRREDPRPRANPHTNSPPPGQQFQQFDQLPGHFFQSPSVPGPGTAPDAESTGGERSRRKSSGLFKEFSSRFAKPSERHGSIEPSVKQHPPAEHINGRSEPDFAIDEMHPNQRKGQNGSFLSSLRGRASMDLISQNQDGMPGPSHLQGPPQVHPDQTRPDTPQSQFQRKHARFASLGLPSGPFKHKSTALPGSSSSSIVNEPGAAMNPLPLPNMPPKRRFSGFSPRSGVFNRSSLDVPPKPGTPNSLRPSTGNQTLDSPEFMAPPPSIGDLARSNTDGPAPLVPPKMPAAGEVLGGPEPRKRRGSGSGLISGFLGHVRNRSQSQGNAVSFPQGQSPPGQGPSPMQSPAVQGPPMHGPSNQLPPAQNPLGQHPPPRSPLAQPPLTQVSQGQFGLSHSSGQVSAGHHPGHRAVRPNPQVQIPSGQGPDGQPIPGLAPQLPPLGPMSPVQLQGQTPWTQLPSGQNSMASQPPARPPIRQQMTETSSLDSQFQSSTERPSTSGRHSTATSQGFEVTENNPSQASLHQAWSSSLRQESPVTAEELPKVTNSPDSPLPSPRNVGSSLVDDASIGMQYGSRGVSPAPSVPLSHALHHTSSKSLDNVLQTNTDVAEVQRTSMHSANLSFQSDVRAGHVRRESHARDDLPTSPISQMSRTGPPSIASSQFNHSPALTSTAPTFNGRASQPGTPSLSAASNTPPMQTQGFGTHAAESVQQQALPSSSHLQQQLQQQVPTSSPFPHQQQPQPPRQTSSASFPQQPGMQPGNPSPVHQAHTLRAHTSIQTMSSPSSQVSMHFPHSSMQMQVLPGSQVPPKNTMPSPGPSPVQIDASPRQDGSASKWRGLKNRISSQTTSKSPHEQGRPEGEEKKTSKLFGAFKRGSKVPPPGQNIPAGFLPPGQGPRPQGTPQQGVPHSQYQMHMRQQMQPGRQIPSVQQPQPFIGQPPHPQGYPCQQPPQSHGPIGQQPSRSMLGVNQQIRQSPPTGQQPFHPRSPAVGLQPRPGPPSGYVIGQRLPENRQPGQQMMNPRNAPQNFQGQVQLQQQRPPQGYTEPQYAQVPIPQGYTAVHGEGIAVPSSYYINKNPGQSHVSQQHQQFIAQPVQYPSQPLHPQARSPVSATGPPMFQGQHLAQVQASLPQSQPQPQAPMSHPASPQATSPKDIAHVRNGLVTQATHSEGDEHSPVESRGGSVDTSSQHPQTQGVTANNSHSTGSRNSSPGGLNTNIVNAADRNTIEPKPKSTRMQENEDGSSKPQSSRGSTGAASPRSPINSGETLSRQQEPQMVTVENGPRRISLSPPTMSDLNISRSHSQDLSTSAVSDEPITDTNVVQDGGKDSSEDVASNATDELEPGNPKESDEAVALGGTDNGALARSKTRNHGAPAELEDTTNAHARKLRLATQEEKIHYDPNADSDGEPPPQMSATSYPGQEWNPYGMPEYGEWNE